MNRQTLALAVACLCAALSQTGASALAPPLTADGRAPVRAKVTFALGGRTGYDFRWEYGVAVHVVARLTGRPLSQVRVVATGKMDVPGHSMQTPPTPLRAQGQGTYLGSLAFYMPGNWRVLVSVRGPGVVPSVTTFPIFLDPSDRAPLP